MSKFYFPDMEISPPSDRIRVRKVLRLIGSGKRVLDIGCSDGIIGSLLMRQNNEVYGIELSHISALKAKRSGLEVFRADSNKLLPFLDSYFDVVFAGEIIEHIVDVDKFLEEIKRVLKRNGFLVLTTPNLASLGRRLLLFWGRDPFIDISWIHNLGHCRYFVKETLLQLLKTHNFTLDVCEADVINFNSSGTLYSSKIAELFPTFGRSIIVKASVDK